jgi:hypothetical protein
VALFEGVEELLEFSGWGSVGPGLPPALQQQPWGEPGADGA